MRSPLFPASSWPKPAPSLVWTRWVFLLLRCPILPSPRVLTSQLHLAAQEAFVKSWHHHPPQLPAKFRNLQYLPGLLAVTPHPEPCSQPMAAGFSHTGFSDPHTQAPSHSSRLDSHATPTPQPHIRLMLTLQCGPESLDPASRSALLHFLELPIIVPKHAFECMGVDRLAGLRASY